MGKWATTFSISINTIVKLNNVDDSELSEIIFSRAAFVIFVTKGVSVSSMVRISGISSRFSIRAPVDKCVITFSVSEVFRLITTDPAAIASNVFIVIVLYGLI